MARLQPDQLAAVRDALGAADPPLSQGQIESLVRAIGRQHEDPEEHDRSLISERMLWSPDERLQALQAFLRFVESARSAREP